MATNIMKTTELSRMASFASLNNIKSEISQIHLARRGFFVTDAESGEITCCGCDSRYVNWSDGSYNPISKHDEQNPSCPAIQLIASSEQDRSETRELINTSKPSELINSRTPPVNDQPATPKYCEYNTLSARINSFRNGVVAVGQSAEKLAEAGFFYVGPRDKVMCFQCGGNLCEWEIDDDPYEEHAKWYGKCDFVKRHTRVGRQPLSAVTCHVEPREIKARMDTPMVRMILDKGFPKNIVKDVITYQLMTYGTDFENAAALVDAILKKNMSPPDNAACSVPQVDPVPPPVDTVVESTGNDLYTCKICMDLQVNTTFLPCGHLVCCDKCAPKIRNCPICRTFIRGSVKVFFS